MKKVFLDDLPKRGNLVDWKKSVGREVYFEYNDISGKVKILEYVRKNYILVQYNDKTQTYNTSDFRRCAIGNIIGAYNYNFTYNIGDTIKISGEDAYKIINQFRDSRGNKSYEYMCLKCKNQSTIKEYQIKKGVGCNVCIINPRKVLIGVNDIATTAPWMVDYLCDKDDAYKYTQSSGKRIKFKCPDCGSIKLMSIDKVNNRGFSCLSCGDGFSIPSKFMYNILNESNIDFVVEYSPKWCVYEFRDKTKKGRYDFYIPSKKVIIEMDGGFHKNDNSMSGQTKEESKYIDDAKDILAKRKGIKIIRIDCCKTSFDYISSNLFNSDIKNFLNLNLIDLKMCYETAQTSKLKEVCMFWENEEKSISKICNKFDISRYTARRYLKEGKKLGICGYTTDLSIQSSNQNRTIKTTSVLCVNNGVIYEGVECLAENSENIFGYKLEKSGIMRVCNGKTKLYKGLKFEYVEKRSTNIKGQCKIICLNDKKIFDDYNECVDYYTRIGYVLNKRNVSDNCRGVSSSTKCGLAFEFIKNN